SATYGLLRSGQSLTPFVLNALLAVPEAGLRAKPAAVDRALEFLKKNTSADGELGRMDQTAADYPNYATSLAVTALVKAGRSGRDPDIARLVAHLRAQPVSEFSEWRQEDAT